MMYTWTEHGSLLISNESENMLTDMETEVNSNLEAMMQY